MIDRREFLKAMAGLTGGLAFSPWLLAQTENHPGQRDRLGELLPQRRLGSTGAMVTLLGLGGWHIGGAMNDAEAQRTIEAALEGGVRFFDNAESYARGEAERRYGRFLTPKYRDVAFVMTKTLGRDADAVRRDLDGSLKRLNTDYIDLWQIHALGSPADVDRRLDGGVLDAVLEAREKGKVRHVGFTGHASPKAHLRMLERTDTLQTCQMPINVLDPSYHSFIQQVLPKLVERKLGVLAMKTLANGRFFRQTASRAGEKASVVPGRVSLEQALSFVLSLPVSVLITGPDNADQMRQNIAIARQFTDMDEPARRDLIDRVADLAGRRVEYYKT